MPTRLLVASLALSLLLLAACTTIENQPASNTAGINVRGVGSVQAKPDIALLTVGVEASDPSVEAARSQAGDAMARLIAAFKANGVADGDIQTDRLSVRTGAGATCSGAPLVLN